MARVRTRVFGPGKALPKRPPVPDAARDKLVRIFHERLDREPAAGKFYIEGESFKRIYVEYQRIGKKAGVVLWRRPDDGGKKRPTRAISILVSGIEPESDKKVLDAVDELRPAMPYPKKLYEDLRQITGPTINTLFVDRPSFEEQIFAVAANCFGLVFYRDDTTAGKAAAR